MGYALRGIICILTLLLVTAMAAAQDGPYYYFKGTKIPLTIDRSRVAIKLSDNAPLDIQGLITQINDLDNDKFTGRPFDGYRAVKIKSSANYDNIVSLLGQYDLIDRVNPVYSLGDSLPLFVGETIVCQFDDKISRSEIEILLNNYHLEIVHQSDYYINEFTLKRKSESNQAIVDIANLIYELPHTIYSHPNFYAELSLDGYVIQDIYYDEQANVQKVVGLPGYPNAAWEITTGLWSVYTVIMDQGIEYHEDLDSSKVTYGWDAVRNLVTQWTLPPPVDDSDTLEIHGMACAGLILAQHNNPVPSSNINKSTSNFYSLAGMAPQSRYFSVRIVSAQDTLVSSDRMGQAFDFARFNGAWVINCSWSYPPSEDPYHPFFFENVDRKIDSAYYHGRNGKGCVIVFSSGNFNIYDLWDIKWPNNKSTVLAVGAVDSNDQRYDYSCYGDSLDLVAPSGDVGPKFPGEPYEGGVWSFDRLDSLGDNPYNAPLCWPNNDMDYYCGFDGTSAAAPLVTGTAALVLAKNPNLTAAQVFEVLKCSAVTELESGTITPPDDEFGYGRVNALRALLAISRGDANNDGAVDVGDVSYLVNSIFKGGPAPIPHPLRGDANCDGLTNVGDIVYLKNYIFSGGPAPAEICCEF